MIWFPVSIRTYLFLIRNSSSPLWGEGKVENPVLRLAQDGERSRTTRGMNRMVPTRGGGEGEPIRMYHRSRDCSVLTTITE